MFCKTWVINKVEKISKGLISRVLRTALVKTDDQLMIAIILGPCMMEILQLPPAVFYLKKRTDL